MRRCTMGMLLLVLPTFAAAAEAGDIVETRTLKETIPLERKEPVLLVVDNVFGPIHVKGHDKAQVEMVAEETTEARSKTAFDHARQDVKLEVGHEGDEVTFVVDGPFRERGEDRFCNPKSLGYTVTYAFEIRVPRKTHLDVRTVNGGDIVVEDVLGDLRVSNVNGEIQLDGVGGGMVRATTVNGPVRAHFEKNPTEDSMFHTINGDLELWLQPGFAAEMKFKTFNGEARTDFDVEPLPSDPAVSETTDGGRRVFRAREWSRVRVGRGGPLFSFETFNGDILIRNARGSDSASR